MVKVDDNPQRMERLKMIRDQILGQNTTSALKNAISGRRADAGAMIPLSLGAALSLLLQVQAGAAGEPLPIKALSINDAHEVVIEYTAGTGKFPTKPVVQDMPGEQHRLVLDFPDAVIDRASMPPAKTALDELTKIFPDVRGIRYAALTGGASPTARIVFDLPQSLQIKPHIVTLGESSVTIDLGFNPPVAAAPAQPPAETAAASQPETAPSTRIQPSENADSTPLSPALASAPPAPAPAAAEPVAPTPEPAAPASAVEKAKTNFPEFAAGGAQPSAPRAEAPPAAAPTVEAKPAKTDSASAEPVESKSTLTSAMDDRTTSSDKTETAKPIASPEKEISQDAPKEETAPVAAQTTKPTELTQSPDTLESRPSHVVDAPKPDPESEATMAASAGKGYDPSSAREAAAAQDEKMAADGAGATGADGGNAVASAAVPGVTAATIQDSAASQKAAALKVEADRHFKAAVKFHMANELPAAIVEYKATIAVNPNLAEPYCNLGLIYNQQHNYQAALDEFHKALAVNPKDAITYNGVGAALRAQKDMVGAMKNWQTAVSLDPKLATALYNLGTAYEMQKDFDKALEAYKQAAVQDGRLGEAYYRMGLILQKRNNPSEAIEEFNKALKASTRAEYSDDARQRIALLSRHTTH